MIDWFEVGALLFLCVHSFLIGLIIGATYHKRILKKSPQSLEEVKNV